MPPKYYLRLIVLTCLYLGIMFKSIFKTVHLVLLKFSFIGSCTLYAATGVSINYFYIFVI